MTMPRMGKACPKQPMGKHESGTAHKPSEMAVKDLRGLKEFKGVCMSDKHPRGKTTG